MKPTNKHWLWSMAMSSLFIILLLPEPALAQRSLTHYLNNFTAFFNDTIIPLIFAIVILFLFVNVTRYFVIESGDASAREVAKKYILYAIIALVIITSLWGIIEVISNGLGLDGEPAICPDYIENCQPDRGGGSSGYNQFNAQDGNPFSTPDVQENDPYFHRETYDGPGVGSNGEFSI